MSLRSSISVIRLCADNVSREGPVILRNKDMEFRELPVNERAEDMGYIRGNYTPYWALHNPVVLVLNTGRK